MRSRLGKAMVIGLGWLIAGFFQVGPVHAEASLTVTPQRYEEVISGTKVLSGFVDVSNPSDTSVQIESMVQGFRQADLAGNLEFFDEAVLSSAINIDLPRFVLGPREAVRVAFRIDPTKLPRGGIYAAIFFRTVPPTPTANTSYIAESAKVGTLLLLQNGSGEHIGAITKFSLPFFQFGNGFSGTARYRNTDRNPTSAAFTPSLSTKVLLWGRAVSFNGPYVLPQSEREFTVHRTGSFVGLLPLSLRDNATSQVVTRWAIICTGWYALILLIGIVLGFLVVTRYLFQRFTRKPVVAKRSFDGLSRKSK